MKKNKFILAAILILATIFGFSCKQQADTEETMKFEAGWYIYTYTAGDLSNILFIKFDSEKTIIKMGNESKEFKGEGLEAYKNNSTFSWKNLVKASEDENTAFRKIAERDLPNWEDNSSEYSVTLIFWIEDLDIGFFRDGKGGQYRYVKANPGDNILSEWPFVDVYPSYNSKYYWDSGKEIICSGFTNIYGYKCPSKSGIHKAKWLVQSKY